MKRLLVNGAILCENGIIADCDYRGDTPEDCETLETDCYLMPSFIELHAHGGGGFDFIDCTPEAFDTILHTHLAHGVTLLCPTLTACQPENMFSFLDMCELYSGKPCFAGAHLEGPFLSPEMIGAQNGRHIIKPNDRITRELAERSNLISRITAAPEIEGVGDFAKKMVSLGVGMSVGHSAAGSETLRRSFDWGFNQITHLYCSTSRSIKRGGRLFGGIVEESLLNDSCYAELIADAHHVSRESFLLAMKCKKGKICAVSDAMRAAGYADSGESFLGEVLPENRVILEDGVAKLPDRSSFAGSLALGDTMVAALCGEYGLTLNDVSEIMSVTPAELLGLRKKGRLLPGYDADFVLLNADYKTTAVYSAGKQVF